MKVFEAGSRPTRRAPKEYFTGAVLQDPIIEAPEPARLRSNRVSFEPIKASRVRIEVQLQPGFSGGILEWRLIE